MKSKKQKINYKSLNIVFGCLMLIMAGGLAYCSVNMKSASDQEYLKLQDHLLDRFVELNYQQEHQVCEMEKHGLSKNNEIFVKFYCQNYDEITHEPVGDKEYHTLYFQHPTTIDGSMTSYAEALGD